MIINLAHHPVYHNTSRLHNRLLMITLLKIKPINVTANQNEIFSFLLMALLKI